MIYEYILKEYGYGRPIFVQDLYLVDSNTSRVRNELKKLSDANKLVWFDKGIYHLPINFTSANEEFEFYREFVNKIIKRRFIGDGYVCGYVVDGKIKSSLTTEGYYDPYKIEIASNNAVMHYREYKIGKYVVAVREPRVYVTFENDMVLSLLDLIKDCRIPESESDLEKIQETIFEYIFKYEIPMNQIIEYAEQYPEKVAWKLLKLKILGFNYNSVNKYKNKKRKSINS